VFKALKLIRKQDFRQITFILSQNINQSYSSIHRGLIQQYLTLQNLPRSKNSAGNRRSKARTHARSEEKFLSSTLEPLYRMAKHRLFCNSFRPDLGRSQSPVQWVRWLFPGNKETAVKNEWSYTSASPVRLHGVNRDDFTFT
jgi:hypothetical protein